MFQIPLFKKGVLASCFLWASSTAAFSAGFQINVQGLRQLAMGNCGVAAPWDNAVIFYNPGALSRIGNGMITGSILGIFPATQLVQPTTGTISNADRQVFTPFNLYASTPIHKVQGLSVGLGVYTPFGTGLKWSNDWTGRYVTQNIGLQSIFFQPTASYRINDLLSVGGGFVYATGNFHLDKALPLQNMAGQDGQAQLKGNAQGLGYNLGVQLQVGQLFAAGVSYRSAVQMKVKSGDATFRVPASVATNFPNTSFAAELPLPSVLSVGVSAKLNQKLSLSLEGNLVGWKAYDTLRFDYAQQTSVLQNTRAPRRYRNTMAARLGAQYSISNKVDLMAGTAYDASPVRNNFVSPDLPDADRIVLTGGLNYKATSRLALTAAIEYVRTEKRQGWYAAESFGGIYQTKAFTAGIGATYTFKK